MNIPQTRINAHSPKLANPLSMEARDKRRFRRALQAWPSAEALQIDLEEREIYRDISTCVRWRSGSRPRQHWLHELLLEMAVEQTRQQIRALEQRLEAIGG
jgi:monoamine oxidase